MRRDFHIPAALLVCALGIGPLGCADDWRVNDRSSPGVPERRVAIVGGEPIGTGEVFTPLMESAGGPVLAELAIDRVLPARLAELGITINEGDLDAEREALIEVGETPPRTGEAMDRETRDRLLDELRRRNGLSLERFSRLLRRNAGLRAIVRRQTPISEAAVDARAQRLLALRHGPRTAARIIVVPTVREAAEVRGRLVGADALAFAAEARAVSIDSSAALGGVLPPISPEDPSLPLALRDAIARTRPGEITPVMIVPSGHAIAMVEASIPPDGVPASERLPALRRAARVQLERAAMDELAERLIDEAGVTIMDPALADSWKRMRAQTGR